MEANQTALESSASLREMLEQMPSPDWVREMIEHYQRTGTYRPQDLRRLLGDPNRCVEVRADGGLSLLSADDDRMPKISDEELTRRENAGGGRPLADILRDLEKLA